MMRSCRALLKELYRLTQGTEVSMSSAALSYCLTLTVFPLTVCLSAALKGLLAPETLEALLGAAFPGVARETLLAHLGYVSRNRSRTMLFAALTVTRLALP